MFSIETSTLATALVFTITLVFSMLGLGGGMLYVPAFKWRALPVKTVAVPLFLLLNGLTTASAFTRYGRETPTKAAPEARTSLRDAKVTHGAAICGVDRRQLETIMARSLAPNQVVEVFLQGMLD